MSGYEVEHNIPKSPDQVEEEQRQARRPDLSTFFSTLEQVDTSGEHTPHSNQNALPLPENVAALFRNLANAFEMMRGGGTGAQRERTEALLENLVEELMRNADNPPEKVEGVSDQFLAELDRVPKKSLKNDESCPICGNPFLDDPYPLVVVLPCHKDHKFDLECITPWLKVNPTCPMDRKDLVKKKPPPPPATDVDEEDYDDYYA